ncbi:MAG: hypothetical protein FJY66_02995 [Calditrichaeota bacterium]|nr:hypothetical protein [Calditrichota bacterium]
MGTYFRCPKEFFQSAFYAAEKSVTPAIALLAVISQVAYGCYWIQGADGTEMEIRPGQFPVNIERLQYLTGWGKDKMNRFLYFLHDNGVLGRKVWNGLTIATLYPEALATLPPFPRKSYRTAPASKNNDAIQEEVTENIGVSEKAEAILQNLESSTSLNRDR